MPGRKLKNFPHAERDFITVIACLAMKKKLKKTKSTFCFMYLNNLKMKLYSILILYLFQITTGLSQPAPAPDQNESIAIVGGKIHIGNGQYIDKGVVLFDKGKILYVGTDLSKASSAKQKLDASGKHVYPGFIATDTQLGLAEIEQVKATIDSREIGRFNTNVRSIISYNTDSKIIPTVRSNGVLMAQIIGQGGLISGQSSVVQLDAWNWEDAAYKKDQGIFLNWPYPNVNGRERSQEERREDTYLKDVKSLQDYFSEALAYNANPDITEMHMGYEAMRGLWTGTKTLYIRVQHAKSIVQAVQFAQKFNLKPVLVDANEAMKVSSFLKENDISLLLGRTHNLPFSADEDIDMPYKLPALLQHEGIPFCISNEGFWQQRNLMFQAGQAIAYGLPYEDAVASISLNAAKILGIDKQCGSLEIGKDATLFVSDGDALDMRSNKLIHAFIQGREIDLDNKQKELYRRYRSKYQSMK